MKIARQQNRRGVTLMELLVVIAIIAIISMIGVPAMKNSAKTDAMGSANRQLLDDIAYARAQAIRNRSTVFMVFLPGDYWKNEAYLQQLLTNPDPEIKLHYEKATELLGLQYAGYAMFAARHAGDQPGQYTPKYLRDWQSLPKGIYIPGWKYDAQGKMMVDFQTVQDVPFPHDNSPTTLTLPCIIFNHMGQLVGGGVGTQAADAVLPLARGHVDIHKHWQTKAVLWDKPGVREDPSGNSQDNFNHIRIDWLTGRARVERPELN